MSPRPAGRVPLRRLAAAAVTAGASVGMLLVVPATSSAEPSTAAATMQELTALAAQEVKAVEDYNEARLKLQKAQRRADELAKRLLTHRASAAAGQQIISELAAAAYRGGHTQVASLISSESPQEFLDQAAALDHIAESQQEQINRFLKAQGALAATESEARRNVAALRKVERTMAARKATIESTIATRRAQMTGLSEEDRARASDPLAGAEGSPRNERADRSRDGGDNLQVPSSGRVAAVIAYARAQIGKPYRWGGEGPDAFDCSGLTMMAWRQAGVALPHSSRAQVVMGTGVSSPAPGDLVFFYSPVSHVGIYVGGGMMIAAPTSGDVVKLQSLYRTPSAIRRF